jgi:hypothetical protein
MMLSDMRRNIRVVMFIVAAAFVAGFLMSELWGMLGNRGSQRRRAQDTKGYVGMVGKHGVTPEEYRGAVSYITDKYKSENRLRDLSNEDYQTIEQQAWKYLVTELTWQKVLKAERVGVTEAEIMEIVQSNPPEELRNKPELLTDGKFDPKKYQQIMNAPENREYFTKYFRQIVEMLPREKLRIDVINAYRVTNPEAEDALAAANTKWKTTSLYFGSKVLKQKYEPTEAETKSWYEANKDSFRTKETRQLRYVFFPMAISRQDSADAKEVIDRAHEQLLKGETFNLTALDYSDLEGETLSAMTPRAGIGVETDSALAKLKPGQYSPPYLAGYGWQISQLDSVKKDSVSYRRIVVRIKMGSEVLATVRDSVRSFVEKAATEKFDTLAVRFGLAVRQTRPLIGDQKELPGLDLESPVGLIEWAEKAKAGQVYDLPQRGTEGYYVFELAEVKPAGVADYEKVKQAVVFRLRVQREKQAWTEMAQQALQAIKAGKGLEQYAAENPGVELQIDSCAGLLDCRRRKGPEFAGAVAALKPGEKYGVVETSWGAFIVRCDERTSVTTLEPAAYLDQRRAQVGQDLMGELLKQPEVKDYRDALAY